MKKTLAVVWRVIRGVVGAFVVGIGGYYICLWLNIGTAYVLSLIKNVWAYVSMNQNILLWGILILIVGSLVADFFIDFVIKKIAKRKKSKSEKKSTDEES